MPSKPPTPNTGARRAAYASAYALLTLVLLGGVVGFAQASDHPWPDPPARYGVAAPRVGDYANYTAVTLERRTVGHEIVDPERPILEFRLLPSRLMHDGDGRPHHVEAVQARTARDGFVDPETYYRDTTDRALVGQGFTFAYDAQNGASSLNGLYPSNWGHDLDFTSTTFFRAPTTGYNENCLFENALQGATVDVSGGVQLFRSCQVPFASPAGGLLATGGRPFEAVTVESLGPHEAVLFQVEYARATIYVWFNESIPYPLQLAAVDDQGHARVLRLNEFQRGAEPLGAGGAQHAPAPVLEWASRRPLDFDEQGLYLEFSLGDALAFMRNDVKSPKLRQFLADHPRAYVESAQHMESKSNRSHQTAWYVSFTDGDKRLGVGVLRERQRTYVPVLGVAGPYADPTFRYANETAERTGDMIPPELLPLEAPTLASLVHVAQSYLPEARFDTWGFSVYCSFRPANSTCQSGRIDLRVGDQDNFVHMDPAYPVYGSFLVEGQRTDFIAGWSQGQEGKETRSVVALHQAFRLHQGPQLTAPTSVPPAEQAGIKPYADRVWVAPDARFAIGATAFAIFVGALYWVWPYTKQLLGLGLFSRLDRPTLLEQPSRQALHDAIVADPGVHFAELCRRTGLGHGVAEHHLRQLVVKGLVTEAQSDGYRCYYVPGAIDASTARALPFLKSDGARAVLRSIHERGGRTATDVARATGLKTPSVHYHVTRLKDAGLIESRRGSVGLELTATPLAAAALAAA